MSASGVTTLHCAGHVVAARRLMGTVSAWLSSRKRIIQCCCRKLSLHFVAIYIQSDKKLLLLLQLHLTPKNLASSTLQVLNGAVLNVCATLSTGDIREASGESKEAKASSETQTEETGSTAVRNLCKFRPVSVEHELFFSLLRHYIWTFVILQQNTATIITPVS